MYLEKENQINKIIYNKQMDRKEQGYQNKKYNYCYDLIIEELNKRKQLLENGTN